MMRKQQYNIGYKLENIGVVSIIVPVYNAARFLDMSLKSLQNQTYPYWEAILINDGSVDNSLEILQQFAANDSRFKVFNKINEGVASARNIGLDVASGAYIAFLDPDDMWCPQFLEIMLKVLQQNNALMAWCKMKRCAENEGLDICGVYSQYHCVSVFQPLEQFISHRKPRVQISVCAKLYKKEVLLNKHFVRSFRVLAEDFYFSLCAFEHIGNAVYITEPLMMYRQNAASLTHRRLSFEAIDDHLRLLQFSVWHFKDALTRRLRLKLWKRLMPVVFRYVCTAPYFENENYFECWQKYSAICRQMIMEGSFFPRCLPMFQRLLCRLFLNEQWAALRVMLRLYSKIRKKPR